MKELRTTFYDLRGYFIPGSIMLWALLELLDLTGYRPTTNVVATLSGSMKAVLFAVIGYSLGHALHAIANVTIDLLAFASYPPKDYFDGKFQKDFSPDMSASLVKSITGMLGIVVDDTSRRTDVVRAAYWMCFQYVMNLQNVETENFLGMSGFYRGMTAAMLVTALMYATAFLMHPQEQLLIIALFALAIGVLFLMRVRRFNHYLAKTVFLNFLHLYNSKQQELVK